MNQKGLVRHSLSDVGLAPILVLAGVLVTAAVLFTPIPYYQKEDVICESWPPQKCPQKGWHLGVPLWKRILPLAQEKAVSQPTIQTSLSPTDASPAPTGAGETANWKTYQNKDVAFKYPSRWEEKPILIRGSGFTQELKDPENKYSFTFSRSGNYSQATGKPYASLDEYLNMPYRVGTVIVAGQEGRQFLPRAGGENINSVVFFSKDSKFIYTIELKTGNTAFDTPETDIKEGQKLFDQILSTLRFLP